MRRRISMRTTNNKSLVARPVALIWICPDMRNLRAYHNDGNTITTCNCDGNDADDVD